MVRRIDGQAREAPPAPATVSSRSRCIRGGRLVSGAILALVACVGPLSAQEKPPRQDAEDVPTRACPGAVVGEISVDNQGVFSQDGDTLEHQGVARVAQLLRAVGKRVHRRTRASFILDELLFREGDCYDEVLVRESGRLLRDFPFLDHAGIAVDSVSADRINVRVTTRDAWSLRVDARPEFDNGLKLSYVGLGEANLWGTGTLVRAYLRERDEHRDLGVEIGRPRLVGTRMNGAVAGGRTRTGVFFHESLSYPFVGEVGRWAFVESYAMREDLFRYSAPRNAGFTHVNLPIQTRRAAVALGLRLGRPGDLTVIAAGASREDVRYEGFPGDITVVRGFDFSNPDTVDATTVALLRPQVEPARATRLSLTVGKRNIGYVERAGLDFIRARQDIRVGTQALINVATTVGGPPTWPGGASHEISGGVTLFGGAAGRRWVLNSELSVEASRILDPPPSGSPYRNILGRAGAYLYWQPTRSESVVPGGDGGAGSHTLVMGLTAAGGWNSSFPFQLTLGGPHGIRGYDREDFPVGQRVLLHLEDRIKLGWPLRDVVDLGFTLFADAGVGWHGQVPFGRDTGLRGAAGFGLRVGFPAETRMIVRVDLAAPLRAGGLRSMQLRIGYDAVNLLDGFNDWQLRRARGTRAGMSLLDR